MALTRAVRSWSQLVLQVLLLLTGLGLLQAVAERTNHRFDLTPGRELSLAPLTQKILGQVSEPLRITVFFRRGTREQYAQLLERLRVLNPAVEFELYDLDRYPERARTLGVTEYGRAAIEYAGRRTVAPALPEEELAGGVLRALRGKARRVAFTIGHGEREPGGGAESYGRLASALAAENYVTEGHSLLDGPLPPETDLVVVAGPKHDFLLPELDELARYLKGGGGVLLFLDPAPLPNLARFLASMGIRLGDDIVVDREKRVLGTDGL
ncbi:MAG TPA: GldG family protein, partial [Verrucomicrobiae bacterium]|nr:GldG family protein [Verrucomicrobiae bacterium]